MSLQASTASNFTGTVFSSATSEVSLGSLTLAGLSQGTTYYIRAGALNWNNVANHTLLGSTVTKGSIAVNTARSGLWSDPETWFGGSVPNYNNGANILAGHAVKLDGDFAVSTVTLFGELAFSTSASATMQLIGGEIRVKSGGSLPIERRRRGGSTSARRRSRARTSEYRTCAGRWVGSSQG